MSSKIGIAQPDNGMRIVGYTDMYWLKALHVAAKSICSEAYTCVCGAHPLDLPHLNLPVSIISVSMLIRHAGALPAASAAAKQREAQLLLLDTFWQISACRCVAKNRRYQRCNLVWIHSSAALYTTALSSSKCNCKALRAFWLRSSVKPAQLETDYRGTFGSWIPRHNPPDGSHQVMLLARCGRAGSRGGQK